MRRLGTLLAAAAAAATAAAAALACNSILGNDGGVYVPPREAGSSSSSSGGSSSSSGGSSSSSSSSSGGSSSGSVLDAGPCGCNEGCVDPSYPRLCTVEELPNELPAAVTDLTATEEALYIQSNDLAGLMRYDVAATTTSLLSGIPRGPLASMYAPDAIDSDVFFVLSEAGSVPTLGEYTGAGQQLQVATLPAPPVQITSAYGRVCAFSAPQGDASRFTFHARDVSASLEDVSVSGTIQRVVMAANSRGVWFAAVPLGAASKQLGLVHQSNAIELYDLPANTGPVQLLAATDTAVYLTGVCPGPDVTICRADVQPGNSGVTLAPALQNGGATTVMHASGGVLYFTEEGSNSVFTYRCDAEHCAESKQQLGTTPIQAFARTTTHDYLALQGGRIRRIERRP